MSDAASRMAGHVHLASASEADGVWHVRQVIGAACRSGDCNVSAASIFSLL